MGNTESKASSSQSQQIADVWSNYQKLRFLGKGGYGEVYQVRRAVAPDFRLIEAGVIDSNQPDVFAIKIVNLTKITTKNCEDEKSKNQLIQDIFREANLWRKLVHPNIVRFYGWSYSDKTSNLLVMELEYANGGDLHDFLKKSLDNKRSLSQNTKKKWCRQLLLGLQALHKMNIIHRDISAQNIVLFGQGEDATLKLTDFGLARLEFPDNVAPEFYFAAWQTHPANCYYAPPEYIDRTRPRDRQSEIWSLGVVFYFMELLRLPFFNETIYGTIATIEQYAKTSPTPTLIPIETVTRLNPLGSLPLLIKRMLVPKPDNRSSAEELLEDAFLKPDKPLQLVSFDDRDRKKLVFHENAIEEIKKLSPISTQLPALVISICGSFRTGKSLTMCLFVRYLEMLEYHGTHDEALAGLRRDKRPLNEFCAKSGANAVTSGIYIWSRPFVITRPNGAKMAIYLLDTEGTRCRAVGINEQDVEDRDYRTLMLASVMSSVQFYNVKGQIQGNDITDIKNFAQFLETLAKPTDGHMPGKKETLLQSLVFLMRDFEHFKMSKPIFGFDPARSHAKSNPAGFEQLKPYFKLLDFFAIPQPHIKARNQEDFDGCLTVADLDGEYGSFVNYCVDLARWTVETAEPLGRGECRNMKIAEMTNLLKDYVKTLNLSQKLQPMCEALAKMANERMVLKWFAQYAKKMEQGIEAIRKNEGILAIDDVDDQAFFGQLQELHQRIYDKSTCGLLNERLAMWEKFREGSRESLEKKMEKLYQSLRDYYQKVRRVEKIGACIGLYPSLPFTYLLGLTMNSELMPQALKIPLRAFSAVLALPGLPFVAAGLGFKAMASKLITKPDVTEIQKPIPPPKPAHLEALYRSFSEERLNNNNNNSGAAASTSGNKNNIRTSRSSTFKK